MNRFKNVLLIGAAACTLAIWLASAPREAGAQEARERKAPAAAATFEVYKDKAGEFRWRLRTQNRQVIATSGAGYAAKRDCLSAIESVKKNAQAAPVEEVQEQAQEPAKGGAQ